MPAPVDPFPNFQPGAIADADQVDARFAALYAASPGLTPFVTVLPAAPADGQECFYVGDDTGGVVWHFRFRTGSASASKWEFVGGPPLFAGSDTEAPATTFPSLSLSVPLPGEYIVESGIRGQANAFPFAARIRVLTPANAEVGSAAWFASTSNGTGFPRYNAVARTKKTLAVGIYTGDIDDLGNNPSIYQAWMSFQPVRVGP